MFEPINRLMFPEPRGRFWGYDLAPVEGLVERVQAIITETTDPAFRAAMMDFDDRDLASLAEKAGFGRVHVECHIDVDQARGDARSALMLSWTARPTQTLRRCERRSPQRWPSPSRFSSAQPSKQRSTNAGGSAAWQWRTSPPLRVPLFSSVPARRSAPTARGRSPLHPSPARAASWRRSPPAAHCRWRETGTRFRAGS